jgi:hypothetical protein
MGREAEAEGSQAYSRFEARAAAPRRITRAANSDEMGASATRSRVLSLRPGEADAGTSQSGRPDVVPCDPGHGSEPDASSLGPVAPSALDQGVDVCKPGARARSSWRVLTTTLFQTPGYVIRSL